MEIIYLEDINLSRLRKINDTGHSESTLFYDKTTIYKLYDVLNDEIRKHKQQKIELLGDGAPLAITVMPKSKVFYGFPINTFEGFTMDYIKSKTFYKKFYKSKDIAGLFRILDTVSRSVMEIHQDPRNIAIGDLHVQNIIVDKYNNPYIVDIDSCKIDGLKNDTAPMGLKKYLSNRDFNTSLDDIEITQNTDRLCLLIMTLGMLFHKHIDAISLYEYDKKSEKIETLKNIRELVVEVQNSFSIPELPYFHELIQSTDIYSKRLKR